MNKLHIIILLFILSLGCLKAQNSISEETAYQKILDNNLILKDGSLKINAQKILTKSTFYLDPTSIQAEFGQFNSEKTDNKFSISQSFRFPGFYQKQKQVYIEEWKKSQLNFSFQKWQLRKELALVFNDLNYLDAKTSLVKKADSLYQVYYSKADLRLKKGESNVLERATAENYRSQAKFQLLEIEKDKAVALEKLNFLINDGNQYSNSPQRFVMLDEAQNLDLEKNPYLQVLKQDEELQKAKTKEVKSKIAPSINIGYNNTSMIGYNENGGYNDGSKRFHSAMLGLGLPLFNKAQKLAVESQQVNEKIAENNYQYAVNAIQSQWNQLKIKYSNALKENLYFHTDGLKNAETILKTANLQFYNGEINYLDYVLLVNQALEIRNRNIDSLKKLNDVAIEINTLNQKGE